MKRIKFVMLALLSAIISATSLTSCSDYQDEIDNLGTLFQNHEQRLKALEELCKNMNEDLSHISPIVNAMEGGDYITSVTEDESGYTINFRKHAPVTIKNGKDGKDGTTPNISVKKADDGLYYWTLNGQWLLADGGMVRASGIDGKNGTDGKDGQNGKDGTDGKDGQNGKDGKDGANGTTPRLRINSDTNEWEVSSDGGTTWVSTGTKATGKDGDKGPQGDKGDKGDTGEQGPKGDKGDMGDSASSLFKSVAVDDEAGKVTFTLNDGTSFTLSMKSLSPTEEEETDNFVKIDEEYVKLDYATVQKKVLTSTRSEYIFTVMFKNLGCVFIRIDSTLLGVRKDLSLIGEPSWRVCAYKDGDREHALFMNYSSGSSGIPMAEGTWVKAEQTDKTNSKYKLEFHFIYKDYYDNKTVHTMTGKYEGTFEPTA